MLFRRERRGETSFAGGVATESAMVWRWPRGVAAAAARTCSVVVAAASRRRRDLSPAQDYGNAENDALDHGKGTMEAINLGNRTKPNGNWSRGAGRGPWIMADLESGLWAGNESVNPQNVPISSPFVTAFLKGRPGAFALKGGDARGGALTTLYDGPRPGGYGAMTKEGAVILGTGGDNSNAAVGTFYEGAITAGWTLDETDAAVHADIVAAGFGT